MLGGNQNLLLLPVAIDMVEPLNPDRPTKTANIQPRPQPRMLDPTKALQHQLGEECHLKEIEVRKPLPKHYGCSFSITPHPCPFLTISLHHRTLVDTLFNGVWQDKMSQAPVWLR